MDANDRQVIEDLFAKLGEVERRTDPRDPEAEALIRRQVGAQPAAPYYMAQTIVMQEYALKAAEQRIAELERQATERPAGAGGFLSGLFGGGARPQAAPPPPPPGYGQQPGYGQPPMMQQPGAMPGRGGGFLAGAAQTAMGVAGGVLLGSAVASMFSSGDAAAAEAAPAEEVSADADGFSDEEEF